MEYIYKLAKQQLPFCKRSCYFLLLVPRTVLPHKLQMSKNNKIKISKTHLSCSQPKSHNKEHAQFTMKNIYIILFIIKNEKKKFHNIFNIIFQLTHFHGFKQFRTIFLNIPKQQKKIFRDITNEIFFCKCRNFTSNGKQR